jgi:hypothetical protein
MSQYLTIPAIASLSTKLIFPKKIGRLLAGIGCLLCFLPSFTHAQVQEKLYWTIPTDSATVIQLELVDQYQVTPWAGSQVMVTAEINLYNASRGVLAHLVESGRYGLIDTLQGPELWLRAEQPQRSPITRGGVVCREDIKVEIFVPKAFVATDERRWVKPE